MRNHQARARTHPTTPPGPATVMRVEHEYGRAGALVYLAAWDVRHAKLFGRCEPKSGIVSFDALVADVMGRAPYATARRVFWIVDNGSSHRGQAAVDRLAKRWPNLILVHLPIHANWLNQVEIVFSILQRKVLHPNTAESLFELEDSILAPKIATSAAPSRSRGNTRARISPGWWRASQPRQYRSHSLPEYVIKFPNTST